MIMVKGGDIGKALMSAGLIGTYLYGVYLSLGEGHLVELWAIFFPPYAWLLVITEVLA